MLDLLFLTLEVVGQVDADRARIQHHLEAVETALRSRDTGHLPPALQAERARNLDRLHAYWTAGLFPRNPEFIGGRVPFFMDEDGVACAVGHLVIESGFADVASEIRERENNARLLDMTHPALSGWIAASGLTAEECAQIQPEYCGCGDEYAPVCGEDGKTYANTCYAETCAMVKVAHAGACAGETSTDDWPEPGTGGTGTTGTTGEESSGSASSSSTTGEDSTSGASTTVEDSSSSSSSEPSSSSTDGPDEPGRSVKKSGCSLGQESSGALALALLLLAPRRRRIRS